VASERLERRLAAVVAADVAGYDRLMRLNDERTLTDLKGARRTLILPASPRIAAASSRPSAARCCSSSPAPSTQRSVRSRSSAAWPHETPPIPADERIEFRIGIHLGDVMIDENDIFGDGVTSPPASKSSPSRRHLHLR